MRAPEPLFSKTRIVIVVAVVVLALLLVGWIRASAPQSPEIVFENNIPAQVSAQTLHLFNGKVASLGWIVGRDCQRGMAAYLKTATVNPDAALVGTGWVDPTTGKLINGQSNNCIPGSLSMDNVVQLVHSKGGMAYLTITMETDGSATSWTSQQQSDYIAKATTNQGYIDTIVNEVKRVNYDGVIMDLEGGDSNYPNIQQLFATYNQRLWDALKPLNKVYGISLVHKVSDHDDYYNINGFTNWSLLAHCADFIIIQAIDQSYFSPGPTVSLPYLRQLLNYALQTMPQMLPRVLWEFPFYGATWHLSGGQWIFDGGMNYADAQTLVSQIPTSEVNSSQSNLNDATSAHLVYTDTSGIEHSMWYPTAKNLDYLLSNFYKMLQQTPQFGKSPFQIAVWYRATWEPGDVWQMIDPLIQAQG